MRRLHLAEITSWLQFEAALSALHCVMTTTCKCSGHHLAVHKPYKLDAEHKGRRYCGCHQ